MLIIESEGLGGSPPVPDPDVPAAAPEGLGVSDIEIKSEGLGSAVPLVVKNMAQKSRVLSESIDSLQWFVSK